MKVLSRFAIVVYVSLFQLSLHGQPFQKIANTEPQSQQNLELKGILAGMKEGEKVVIRKFFYPFTGEDSWKVVDTVYVKDGRFDFVHKMVDGPRLFNFSFSEHNCYIVVALGGEKVTLSSDRDIDSYASPNTATSVGEFLKFDGSKTADEFLYLDNAVLRVWYWSFGGVNNLIRQFKDSSLSPSTLSHVAGLLSAKSSISNAARSSMVFPFVRKLTPELFTECQGEMMRDSIWVSIYNKLDDETKNTYNGKIMKEYLPLCMGQLAPDFSFQTSGNKTMKLSDISKNNKCTIVHFWSNGSANRREIHKDLADAYQKYHSKGLEVVSVSFDGNEVKWKRGIQEDKIPGMQTCDFKEEESPIAKLYNVDPRSTINLLIDKNGKMVAWDVDGPALFGHLYKLFKE